MVIIVFVQLAVQLQSALAACCSEDSQHISYQIQHGNLHHTLIEVCSPILYDFDRYNFLRLQILAFDYLPERALSEDVENQISIPGCRSIHDGRLRVGTLYILVAVLLVPKDVIDVENVVTVFVVETIVLHAFAWLGKDPSWIPRRFVFEGGVTYSICGGEMRCQGLQGLLMAG